jgi:outer membrane protein assembly factor BamB
LLQRSRLFAVSVGLLLFVIVMAGCGSAPVAENWPGLSVYGDTVYVTSGTPQQIYMLDAESGALKGTFLPPGEHRGAIYWSPVTEAEGVAYVGFSEPQEENAGLYAFDPQTGQGLWNIPAKDIILPAPTYADGVLYYGATSGHVYAVDVESKTVKPGWPFLTDSTVWAAPLVVGDRVYVAGMDHHVYALDAETGEQIWKVKTSGAMAAQPSLSLVGDILYVGTFTARSHAIDAASGELLDEFEFKAKNWIWSEVLVQEDELYVTSLDGMLYALDPATGAEIPPYPFDSSQVSGQDDRLRAAPVQAGDSIIIATESGQVISVLDARMQWVWPSGTPEAQILTTPIVRDGTVYVVQMNGHLQTLDAETGAQGWVFAPPEPD